MFIADGLIAKTLLAGIKEIIIKAVYGLGNQLKTEKEKLDTYTISNDNIEKNIK